MMEIAFQSLDTKRSDSVRLSLTAETTGPK
jgi:hypothetical protein